MKQDTAFAKRFRSLLRTKVVEKAESLRDAGERMGVSPVMVHRALDGRVPGPEALVKIARANNVTIDWLLTGKTD